MSASVLLRVDNVGKTFDRRDKPTVEALSPALADSSLELPPANATFSSGVSALSTLKIPFMMA